jgi:hypothetical protein
MTIIEFVVFGLATWRIASLLVDEPGPFRIFIRIRSWVGITHDMDDNVAVIPDGFLPEMLSCLWCCSIWVGVACTTMYLLLPQISFYLALPFALSALAIKWHPA